MGNETVLVLAGDVMTGRGIDQILPRPGSPRLHEEYVVDARSYVDLAEKVNGPIPRPVEPAWPGGDALEVMEAVGPSVRVMNLETSVTRSEEVYPGKAVHYRMNPANLGCLEACGADVWTLSNNHVLDYGVPGLVETLECLHEAGLRTTGAGLDESRAWRPAHVDLAGTGVVVSSVADTSSGVPLRWAATDDRPGVALLPDLSDRTADMVADGLRQAAGPEGIRVVSIHWGGNWGFRVSHEQRHFAHRLIDAGVHVVHGHSSHHPRPLEVYRGHLVLYGCGDLVNDYEGISGYEGFRDDLRLLYVARLASGSGELLRLTMVPFQARRMRLWYAAAEDVAWLATTLDRACEQTGSAVEVDEGSLVLRQER